MNGQLPGAVFVDGAVDRALALIPPGNDPLDDLYRVSIGATVGALPFVIATDDALAKLWGTGTGPKARAALAVWASTILLYLRQKDVDRRATIDALSENFAVLCGIDAALISAELSVLDAQRLASLRFATEGRTFFGHTIALYLRLRRALGDKKVPHFSRLPNELSATELAEAGFGALYPALSSIVLTSRISTESLRAAYEAFQSREG